MTKAVARLAALAGAIALLLGLAVPAGAGTAPFTCSYSGNTTIQWHSDRLNKLEVTEVIVMWEDGSYNILSSVDDVFSPPKRAGRLSWATPPNTLEVNYDVEGTINGGAEESLFAGLTECSP
jgi:hypothetical protein